MPWLVLVIGPPSPPCMYFSTRVKSLSSATLLLANKKTAAASAEGCGNPHVYTVRTMRAYTGGGPDLI